MGMKAGKRKKTIEYGRYGYYFIAPFFIVYCLFSLYPLLYTVYLSFMENYSRGLNEVGPNFVGLDNYIGLFKDSASGWFQTFTFRSLYNTFILWICNFVPQILVALLLAAWFTDTRVKLRGQGAFKIMIYMPNIITAATIAVLFYSLFSLTGPITIALKNIGILAPDYDFMQSKAGSRGIISFIQFWMWYGNTMILLIAGILGINPSLFEAAQVDGANSKQMFRMITLPLLKPITLYVLVTSAIGGLQMYDIPALFNITSNGDALPDYATLTITMYIRKLSTASKDYGKAAAVSMVLFIVTLLVSLLFFATMRDDDKKGKKKGV